MVEKRYQVFVSSTFQDLIEERQEIIQALLELDCIPSGMELFPAANEDQWTLIKKVIDDCDYYIVVIAGKYGSIGPSGISYTEMEYRYALERGKPILAFLLKNIEKLAFDRVENDPDKRQRLNELVAFAKQKMVRFWETPVELGSVVSRSLIQLTKNFPAVGWIRADNLPDESAAQEILKLRKEIDRLRADTRKASNVLPPTTKLVQGEEQLDIECIVSLSERGAGWVVTRYRLPCKASVNALIAATAPSMIDEASQATLKDKLSAFFQARESQRVRESPQAEGRNLQQIEITDTSFDTYIIQMAALEIIEKSVRTRSVKDQGTYWRLTTLGETMMYKLRAVTRPAAQSPLPATRGDDKIEV